MDDFGIQNVVLDAQYSEPKCHMDTGMEVILHSEFQDVCFEYSKGEFEFIVGAFEKVECIPWVALT